MTEVLKPKVEASGWLDLLLIGVAKKFEQSFTAPYVGQGNIIAAGAKGIVGGLIQPHGRIGNVVGGAFLVDAGDDAATFAMGMLGIGSGGGAGTGSGQKKDMTNAMNW
jgi:hypothetical protein